MSATVVSRPPLLGVGRGVRAKGRLIYPLNPTHRAHKSMHDLLEVQKSHIFFTIYTAYIVIVPHETYFSGEGWPPSTPPYTLY